MSHKLSLIIAIAMLLFSLFISNVQGAYYYRNTDYCLSIPNSNVFLNFDEYRDFDNFFPDNGTGTLFFDLPEEYMISSLTFSGENCNVTINELGENTKLYVANIVAGSDSTVNFTLDYNLPYVQVVEGNITTIEVNPIENNQLTWKLTGDESTTMKIPCEGHTPYYLKINGVVKAEGDYWSKSGTTVTVTDNLGSTHEYELGFSALPIPPTPPDNDEDDDIIEQLKEIIEDTPPLVIANWGVFILAGFIILLFVLLCAKKKGVFD